MSEASSEKVRIVCGTCGGRFKAPASKAGKKGKCPKCGAIFTVPEPEPVDVAGGQPADDVDWAAISGHAAQPASQEEPVLARTAAKPAGGAARRGATTVGKGALGGLTAEQRQMLAARVQEKMTRDFQKFEEEEPSGTLPAGVVGAIICALLGAGLWFGIFAGTGKELRFMSLVVGILAGGGMYLGLQRRSSTAAIAAAAITLGAVVVAKVAFVGWGEPFKVAAMPPPKVNKVEQQIDDQYMRPDPDRVIGSSKAWVQQDYMYEHNLTFRTMGNTEWEREKHEWAMIDRHEALGQDADAMFAAFYRWHYYSDHLPERQRQAERDWDAAKQSMAAEEAMARNPGVAGEVEQPGLEADAEAGNDTAARNGAAAGEEADDEQVEEPIEVRSHAWSPEKRAAMEKAFAELERSFFMEVKEMPVEDMKRYHDEQREAERRALKIAAKQSGEEIEEKFVELGEDPVAAAAAAEEAKKYTPIDVQDIIAIPLALAAAWFLGRGWN